MNNTVPLLHKHKLGMNDITKPLLLLLPFETLVLAFSCKGISNCTAAAAAFEAVPCSRKEDKADTYTIHTKNEV